MYKTEQHPISHLAACEQTRNVTQILSIPLEFLVQDASADPNYVTVNASKQAQSGISAERFYPFSRQTG